MHEHFAMSIWWVNAIKSYSSWCSPLRAYTTTLRCRAHSRRRQIYMPSIRTLNYFNCRRPYTPVVCVFQTCRQMRNIWAPLVLTVFIGSAMASFSHTLMSRGDGCLQPKTKTISVRFIPPKKGKHYQLFFLHCGSQWGQSRHRHGGLKQRATLRFFCCRSIVILLLEKAINISLANKMRRRPGKLMSKRNDNDLPECLLEDIFCNESSWRRKQCRCASLLLSTEWRW